ncbi:hypothetical protein LAZ67_7003387 [Cordylochernes scorpioides]|uniref:CCHC-type domain-containing protein n=1 Tax=Cordylochernes scorpioides TaxID=51811 RepID=A0ABY6KRP3_9ARAC|nr:hypothetical protein LAZ67_7003387 [Cordylochernes scorpioides]
MNSYCSKCKKKGHYAKVCRSEAINEIKSEIAFLGSIEDNSKKWIVPIKVNNRQINFKIDTGADVNVLPLQNYYQSFQRIKLEKSDKILQGPNGIPLETFGMIHVKLQNKGQHLNSKIYIVDKLKQPLLSGETSEKLNIVRMIQQFSSGGRGGQRGRLGSGDNRGCYNCGEEGHRKFECTKPARGGGRGRGKSRDGGSNNTCYNCGEVGHRKYECTNNTAEDGGQEENQRKSKKFGHKKDDCPKSGTQESGDEEEFSDNEEEETPQKRKQAEDSEEKEVEAEEPPKKKSKKPKSKKKEEDCYLTLQAHRTMPLESARSREMRRPPLRHQPGSQGDARMTRSKRPRKIALHQRPHLQEMEGCRGTTKTRIQRRASLQCQPCIQDMEGQSRYLEGSCKVLLIVFSIVRSPAKSRVAIPSPSVLSRDRIWLDFMLCCKVLLPFPRSDILPVPQPPENVTFSDDDSDRREQQSDDTNFEAGHKNIVNPPLIDSENIYLPPLHIRLELMKNFVKAMDRNASGFAYLKQKCSNMSDAKIKEGIFVGPQIRELPQNGNFQNSLKHQHGIPL